MKINKALAIKIAGGAIGSVLGFLYWRFYGCEEGCAITSNMYLTTAYGALMGYLLISSFENLFVKKEDEKTIKP
jgi:hypothetical protein